jgi:hypothetical protein
VIFSLSIHDSDAAETIVRRRIIRPRGQDVQRGAEPVPVPRATTA